MKYSAIAESIDHPLGLEKYNISIAPGPGPGMPANQATISCRWDPDPSLSYGGWYDSPILSPEIVDNQLHLKS
jgi:hypothetical protein